MKLYHGSNTGGIRVLEPRLADHGKPYIYLTANEAVAAIYLCNPLEKPYYWFPYGFQKGTDVPVYHELYPNALREVSEGVSGYIYEVAVPDAETETERKEKAGEKAQSRTESKTGEKTESKTGEKAEWKAGVKAQSRTESKTKAIRVPELQMLPGIPCARLSTEPLTVSGCKRIDNAWELFLQYIHDGRLLLAPYEKKTKEELAWWEADILDCLERKNIRQTPECAYARFIREKFPQVWEKYQNGHEFS